MEGWRGNGNGEAGTRKTEGGRVKWVAEGRGRGGGKR